MRKFKFNIFHLHLSAKILIFNLLALVLLLIGILYLTQFREGLIESKIESLAVQSEIISATISASATSSKGANLFVFDKNIDGTEAFDQRVIQYRNYTINKKLLENIIGQLINPEILNAKIYDSNNNIIHDSDYYFYGKNINKDALNPIEKNYFKVFYSKFIKEIGFDSIYDLNY
jgi:two-component system sensor histidine kinase ChvG